ncbi:MAG TPA: histidine-type phosphatase [Rhizobacter sp.]|nr:histidine-type phosphatase [Rhizobacter sp.]
MKLETRESHLARWALCGLVMALAACGGDSDDPVPPAPTRTEYYQTKTPYSPQQAASTYEAPPAGYSVVYTELMARHGSRGLSSMKYDLAVLNMWDQAKADNALTPLGAKLGPDVLKIMKANFLLGDRVDGISRPGYGNETQVGIEEHTALAKRMLSRNAALFAQVGAQAASQPRQIVVVTSGVDRAVDSGYFFVKSLKAAQSNLTSLVTYPSAPATYPEGAPVAQPDGTNRFQLYFHKLVPATDLVTTPTDPLYTTYQDSQAFQAWTNDAELAAKQAAVLAEPAAKAAGRTLLERLFTKAFVDKIDAGTYKFANTGTRSFASDDGRFTNTQVGDGKTKISSLAEAASILYELYVIAPAMLSEAGVDFTPYMPSEQAKYLAYTNDASDFYKMGPSITEKGSVTWKMAQSLEDDFFNEVDAIAKGDLGHAAKLRFAHAEIVVPFASKLGLKNVAVQVPRAQSYSYDTNPWRGEIVSPMAANVQWDVVRNATGKVLVKMLYNEKETDFKAACDGARFAANSHYYDYTLLKACYGHTAAP